MFSDIRVPMEALKAHPIVVYGAGNQARIELQQLREAGLFP